MWSMDITQSTVMTLSVIISYLTRDNKSLVAYNATVDNPGCADDSEYWFNFISVRI